MQRLDMEYVDNISNNLGVVGKLEITIHIHIHIPIA